MRRFTLLPLILLAGLYSGCGSSEGAVGVSSAPPAQTDPTLTSRTITLRHSTDSQSNKVMLFGFDADGKLVFKTPLQAFSETQVISVPSSLLRLMARYHNPEGLVSYAEVSLSQPSKTPVQLSAEPFAAYNSSQPIMQPKDVTVLAGFSWRRHIQTLVPVGRVFWASNHPEVVSFEDYSQSVTAGFAALAPGTSAGNAQWVDQDRPLLFSTHVVAPGDLDRFNLAITSNGLAQNSMNVSLLDREPLVVRVLEDENSLFYSPVHWSTDSPEIAVVQEKLGPGDQFADVVPMAFGTTLLRANLGSRVLTVPINVTIDDLQSLRIQPNPVLIKQSQAVPLKVLAVSTGAVETDVTNMVTWTSSNPAIATVSATGQLSGQSSGFCTIKANFYNRAEASVEVGIEPGP